MGEEWKETSHHDFVSLNHIIAFPHFKLFRRQKPIVSKQYSIPWKFPITHPQKENPDNKECQLQQTFRFQDFCYLN